MHGAHDLQTLSIVLERASLGKCSPEAFQDIAARLTHPVLALARSLRRHQLTAAIRECKCSSRSMALQWMTGRTALGEAASRVLG